MVMPNMHVKIEGGGRSQHRSLKLLCASQECLDPAHVPGSALSSPTICLPIVLPSTLLPPWIASWITLDHLFPTHPMLPPKLHASSATMEIGFGPSMHWRGIPLRSMAQMFHLKENFKIHIHFILLARAFID